METLALKLGALLLPPKAKRPTKREPRFEVLWYEGNTEEEALRGDYHTKEFFTKKQALAYYQAHKGDANRFGWWVTHRDADWDVLETLVG